MDIIIKLLVVVCVQVFSATARGREPLNDLAASRHLLFAALVDTLVVDAALLKAVEFAAVVVTASVVVTVVGSARRLVIAYNYKVVY